MKKLFWGNSIWIFTTYSMPNVYEIISIMLTKNLASYCLNCQSSIVIQNYMFCWQGRYMKEDILQSRNQKTSIIPFMSEYNHKRQSCTLAHHVITSVTGVPPYNSAEYSCVNERKKANQFIPHVRQQLSLRFDRN